MSVTQKQIALKIGVSPQAVGFALRGDGTLSEETRRSILRAAFELGYNPHANSAARMMAAQRNGQRVQHRTIGVLPMDESHNPLPYYAHLQKGIVRAAHDAGFEVLTINPTPSAGWERVDGIIGHGERDDARISQSAVPMPYVGLMHNCRERWGVSADVVHGTRQAVRHLLELGHRRIGYLGNPEVHSVSRRIHAYRETLEAAGVKVNPLHQWFLWDWGPMQKSGRLSMESWLQSNFQDLQMTALLVQNDRAAVGAMGVLQNAGYRVPQDISVIGFDSTDECDLSSPRLTSVRVPLDEIGAKAAELLLMQIHHSEGEILPQNVVLPVELEIRDSTAAVAEV